MKKRKVQSVGEVGGKMTKPGKKANFEVNFYIVD